MVYSPIIGRRIQVDQSSPFQYRLPYFIKSPSVIYIFFFRNQAEESHTCRGTINLANSFIHTEDSCSFVVSNGGTQTFHLKANSEVERQKWVTALELAKSKAVNMVESG